MWTPYIVLIGCSIAHEYVHYVAYIHFYTVTLRAYICWRSVNYENGLYNALTVSSRGTMYVAGQTGAKK